MRRLGRKSAWLRLEYLWVTGFRAANRLWAQYPIGSPFYKPGDFLAGPKYMPFALEAKLCLFQKS